MAAHKKARRAAIVLFAGVLTVSCVDLFHSTDFATLCTDSPSDPQCVDGAVVPDASVDTSVVTTRPHPDFCSWLPTTVYANATKVCARLGGCVGPLPASTPVYGGGTEFGACVIAAQLAFDCTTNPALRPSGPTDDFWSCVSTATSCTQIQECVYPKGVDICGNEGGTGSFTACGNVEGNANVQLKCGVSMYGPSLAATPCVMNGQQCSRDNLSSSACSGPQGFQCSSSTCQGTFATDCNNPPVDHGVDCASMSATCVLQDGGTPGCKPTASDAKLAPSCDDTGPVTCGAGDKAQACLDGKLVTVDCAHLGNPAGITPGLPCDVTTPPPFYAVANACIDTAGTCMPSMEGCGGNSLTACARGREVKIDCTSAGFTGCDGTDGTASNPPHCKGPNDSFDPASH